MNKYNPKAKYFQGGQPGALPNGTHIQWPDGEKGTIDQSYLGTRHLVRRGAVGGGVKQDTFDLAKEEGLKVSIKPVQ